MKNKKLSISFVQRRVITSLITCLLLVAENKVQAATFFANDWTSLQTAITNALAHADPASTINITGGINLSSGLTIPAGADITLNYSGGNIYIQASGTITVASGASLTITGIQDAIVVSGGTFINNGNLTITSTNSGIRNGGTFTNNSTGKITLSTPNGRIENIGAFVNYGAIINNGIITETTTTTGSIINNGSITNNNVLENSTTLTNNGTITGNITNFNNRLIPQVDGTLTNNGTIDGTIYGGTVVNNVAPTISGPASMSLTEGYAAISTGAYTVTGATVTGNPTFALTVTLDNTYGGLIVWNPTTKMLDIAPGLAAGSYPLVLTAANGTSPDATHNFALTVNAAPVPPAPIYRPTIEGPRFLTLKTGYAATSTEPYTIGGTSPVTVTITQTDSDKITWNNATRKLDIAEGLPAGKYEVTLRASNTAGSATLTFTLTVENPVYWMEIPKFVGGKVESSPLYIAEEGQTVTLTITPDEGYELESIMVTDMNNTKIIVPLSGTGNIRTFTMPAHHINVVAVFKSTANSIDDIKANAFNAHAQNGMLYISGLSTGQQFSVYNILGALVYQGVATGDKAEILLLGRGVYIVTDGSTVIKVNK